MKETFRIALGKAEISNRSASLLDCIMREQIANKINVNFKII